MLNVEGHMVVLCGYQISVFFFVTDTVKGIRTVLLLSPWLPIQESQV